MTIHESARAFKIEAPEARSFHMRGTLWTVLADRDNTDGAVGALDERLSHGIRAPMHLHYDADEIFYVLEGNLTFFVGAQRIEAAAGAFVYLPRLVYHGFQCNSTEARVFNFVTPAGFEQLILDTGTAAQFDDGPIPDNPRLTHGPRPSAIDEREKYQMRTLPMGSL